MNTQKLDVPDIRLDLPYFTQLNNLYNPYGACGPTAAAMCVRFFGKKPKNLNIQLDDEIYAYMENIGLNRHVPEDLAIAIQKYGLKDKFSRTSNLKECVEHLKTGNPCITAGWFTAAGHQIAIAGCGAKGKLTNEPYLLVHDPYGEALRHGGYNNNVSGAFLEYSFEMIRRLCMDDGYLWLHRISA